MTQKETNEGWIQQVKLETVAGKNPRQINQWIRGKTVPGKEESRPIKTEYQRERGKDWLYWEVRVSRIWKSDQNPQIPVFLC